MELREMLELAALAAGIRLEWDGEPSKWQAMYYKGKTYHAFSPESDDGDSRRLEVKLGIEVFSDDLGVYCNHSKTQQVRIYFSKIPDPLAATRMAVLRCAAEIGKQLKGNHNENHSSVSDTCGGASGNTSPVHSV